MDGEGIFSQAGRGGARPTIYGSGKGSKSAGWGGAHIAYISSLKLYAAVEETN